MAILTAPDLQDAPPAVALALDRVGVTGVPRTVRDESGRTQHLTVSAWVDVPAERGGAHMSRFHEALAAAVEAATPEGDGALDALARTIAQDLVGRQQCAAALVAIEAIDTVEDRAPVSGVPTHEPVTWIARAAARRGGETRSAIGVRATGFNACPCAQGLVREAAAERLSAAGFDGEQVRTVLELVPAASHNQRAEATLIVGSERPVDRTVLLDVARNAMSARTYELLKRPDELHVVERAHRRPMFVEDSARAMLAGVLDALGLDDGDVIAVSQRNFESIHTHDVTASRTVLAGQLRAELAGDAPHPGPGSLDAWLGARSGD